MIPPCTRVRVWWDPVFITIQGKRMDGQLEREPADEIRRVEGRQGDPGSRAARKEGLGGAGHTHASARPLINGKRLFLRGRQKEGRYRQILIMLQSE